MTEEEVIQTRLSRRSVLTTEGRPSAVCYDTSAASAPDDLIVKGAILKNFLDRACRFCCTFPSFEQSSL